MNEKFFREINRSKQGMLLQSENTENPVLLYLHGGPGAPEIVFAEKYPTGLEKLFTVCWWEQRGCGISYNRKITPKEMTLEQMVSDTIEVTHYLRNRFGKEKIYIRGHSWGSLLGVITVKQQPEFFHAYIGIGQVAQALLMVHIFNPILKEVILIKQHMLRIKSEKAFYCSQHVSKSNPRVWMYYTLEKAFYNLIYN